MSLKFRYRILRDGNGRFKAQYRVGFMFQWHSLVVFDNDWQQYTTELFPSWTKAEDALRAKHEDLVRAERARTWTLVREGELNGTDT